MSKLVVEDLTIEFGGVKALQNISLEVPSCSFVGLMGPNGAGKTTLINCLSRIYTPSSGKMKFGDHDLLKLTGDKILEIGISRTFQDLNFFNLLPNVSVIDYMRLGGFALDMNNILSGGIRSNHSIQYEKQLKKKSRRILDFFRQAREYLEPSEKDRGYPFLYGQEGFADLIDVENTPIGRLSFAWRKRLDIARALVSMPKLILLDEPAQGMPPTEIENLGRILKFIQAEFSVSALIVEHNVDTLMKISDHIMVMNSGKTIAYGLPNEVGTNKDVLRLYLGSPELQVEDTKSTEKKGIEKIDRQNKVEMPLLELRDIDLYYGSIQALFSVSMKFYRQEVISILGTNGSGKSTVLKAIAGVEKPSLGEILFEGESLPLGWPEVTVKYGIQYVPQGRMIFPELSVLDNIKIGSIFHNGKKIKFSDTLEKVLHYFPMLKNNLKSQAGSLSGGQQQMIAISQAITSFPKIVLLDEPTLGLSPLLIDALFEIIRKISVGENCVIVLVEQNVAKALEISDYVFMLSTGMVIGEGSAEKLMENDHVLKRYLGFR